VENTEFTSAEKSTHVSVAGQGHDLCFFENKGTDNYEFTAQGQTVSHQYYLEVLSRLGNVFGGKHPDSGLISGFSTTKMPLRMTR
jgi:hypothetical protein